MNQTLPAKTDAALSQKNGILNYAANGTSEFAKLMQFSASSANCAAPTLQGH
jgi:hypothetical protein